VFAQFHDYLPGSSVADVYVEGIPELRRLAAAEIAAARAALSRGRNREEQFFNPVPLRWEGVVRTARGRAAWVALPPLGSAAPAESPPACPPKVTIAARRIGNGIVAAEIGADGYLAALRIAGHDVRLQGPAAVPVLYPDLVANYDAWDVDRHSLDLGQRVDTAVTFGAECDPTGLTAAIVARRRLGRASELVVRYVLHAGESVLRIEAEVDWREEQTWLKLHFPTAYRGSMARFGAPFGSVLRRQQSGPLATEAQWEVPGSRWATVAADGEREGLMLLSEAKYGFSARDGDLTVSLLRSARITGTDDHRYAAPPQLSRLVLPTPFSDRGQHRIRLAVGSYDLGAPREEQPAALAETLFTSPVAFRGAPLSAGLRGLVGGESLIPSWAVPVSATEWRLRLHEVAGQHGVACLELERGWSARPCTLDGRPIPGSTPTNEISFRPYEILTVQLIRP
jgi:alpha-mannosidase